jgi:hypothetical protein
MTIIFDLFCEITREHDVTIICFSLTFLGIFYMRVSEKKVLKRSFIVAVIDEREMRHYLFLHEKGLILLFTKTNICIYVNASLNIFLLIRRK